MHASDILPVLVEWQACVRPMEAKTAYRFPGNEAIIAAVNQEERPLCQSAPFNPGSSALRGPLTLVQGKRSIRVTFRPEGTPWTIGELRVLTHVAPSL